MSRRQSAFDRLVDRALGVSRRRRQVAYLAIGGGLSLLRPVLRRTAATGAVAAVGATAVVLF